MQIRFSSLQIHVTTTTTTTTNDIVNIVEEIVFSKKFENYFISLRLFSRQPNAVVFPKLFLSHGQKTSSADHKVTWRSLLAIFSQIF